MEIKALTGKEICNIIEVSAKSGVTELNLGDFRVSFKSEGTRLAVEAEPFNYVGTQELANENKQQEEKFELSIAQERAKEDLELAQSMIDDPMGFEQEVIDSYINGAVDGNNEFGRVESSL
jgi:hypothetical protein